MPSKGVKFRAGLQDTGISVSMDGCMAAEPSELAEFSMSRAGHRIFTTGLNHSHKRTRSKTTSKKAKIVLNSFAAFAEPPEPPRKNLLAWVLCFLIHFILNCFELKAWCSFEEPGLGCYWGDIQKKPLVFLEEGLSKVQRKQTPPSLHVNGKSRRMENEPKAGIFRMRSCSVSGVRCCGFSNSLCWAQDGVVSLHFEFSCS